MCMHKHFLMREEALYCTLALLFILVLTFSKRQMKSYLLLTWILVKLVLVLLVCMVTSTEYTIGNKYLLEPGWKSHWYWNFVCFFQRNKHLHSIESSFNNCIFYFEGDVLYKGELFTKNSSNRNNYTIRYKYIGTRFGEAILFAQMNVTGAQVSLNFSQKTIMLNKYYGFKCAMKSKWKY